MRDQISIKLVCNECGNKLEVSYDKSKISAASACNLTTTLSILPCHHCKEIYARPAKLIREALGCMEVSQQLEKGRQ